jgi:hypothetical protein
LQPDPTSTTTAILVLTAKMTSTTGGTIQTVTETYRVTPSGLTTWLSLTFVGAGDSLVLTAQ